MKVTITFENGHNSKTFISNKVLFLSDWLTVVDDATRSEFLGTEGIACERSNGQVVWSNAKELPLW